MISKKWILVVVGLIVACAQGVLCTPILLTRDLGSQQTVIYIPQVIPIDGSGPYYVAGDSVKMPVNIYGQWRIDSMTLYSVASITTIANLDDEFGTLTFYTGDTYTGIGPRLSGDIGPGNVNTNTDITHARAGTYMQGATAFPIWATTFSNLNWLVSTDPVELFVGMWASGGKVNPAPLTNTIGWGDWYNLYRKHPTLDPSSPAAFMDLLGADARYEIFSGNSADAGLYGPYLWDPVTGNQGWGDLNLTITAEAVPEPGTLSLFALGGVALLALRRRRQR